MKKFFFTDKGRRTALIFLSWLCLWEILAAAVGNRILLVGPFQVAKQLISLLPQQDFWYSVLFSFRKICAGFLAAFFLGILAGRAAFSCSLLREFLAPAVAFIKSVPVASFVILALIWTGSENLSVLIAFFVVFPIIYTNTVTGLAHTDKELLEMAKVFGIGGWRKFAGIYWPSLLPYLTSGCKTALGMSWKSGIAAEVIGVPEHTIGEQLYLSKIYLDTAGLFAWTLVIIAVSAGFEAVFLALLGQTGKGRLLVPVGIRKNFASGNTDGGRDKEVGMGASKEEIKEENRGTGRKVNERTNIENDRRADRRTNGRTNIKTSEETDKGTNRETDKETNRKTTNETKKETTVTLSGLSKTFGELSVLREVDFRLTSRQPCCFMGASGSGKTTLLRILLGLETADSGEIRADNPLFPASAVFQENRLCERFSPVDNLRLALPGLSVTEIRKELSRLLPEECLARPVSTLSGGMKRRTAIVRALLAPSNMLIMDEPFTGLDEETKEIVICYILEKREGRLLILSTHQEEDIELMGGKKYMLQAIGNRGTTE